MEIALSNIERLHAQSRALMSQSSTSPSLSHSSPEPQATSPSARIPSMSAVHGAMLSHSHELLSKLHKTSYSSPPPIACSPENNVCKLISYRNAKIAAFVVDGRELICLPQAFELFLKHLVGGLHTVYTKLKRLDITPVVCNVEQVRVLRGLGAIQPGVNRCKLISCKEFDILYDDCTNSSARPGRPPKRSPSLHASPETIDKLKKARFDGSDYYSTRLFDTKSFLNGFPPHPYTMGHLPFMQLNHPLIPPPVTLAMAQQLGLRHDGMMGRDPSHLGTERLPTSDENKTSPSPKPNEPPQFHPAYQRPILKDNDMNIPLNLHINGHADQSRRSPIDKSDDDGDDIDDDNLSDDDDKSADNNNDALDTVSHPDPDERTRSQCQSAPPSLDNQPLEGYSSIETLLMNIQGLLKVAAENARHQERKTGMEKAELKMEVYQQKKLREDLEKEIKELNSQIDNLQRRLKKERRARRRLEGHTDNQTDRHTNGGYNHDLNNFKVNETDMKERNPSGSSNSSLSDIDRNGQNDCAAGPSIGYWVLNSRHPAFTHERFDRSYTDHVYGTGNAYTARGTEYSSSTETSFTTGRVVRYPQMQAAGSRMNAFTDRVSTMSKDIYKKSLGMQNYVTYSIDSMCTESTLGRCLYEMDWLLKNYGNISSSNYYSEDTSLLSCLESMWSRISQLEGDLQITDNEIASLKVAVAEHVRERYHLEEKYKRAEAEIVALHDANKRRVKENKDLCCDIEHLTVQFEQMHVSPNGLSNIRWKRSYAQNQNSEVYQYCQKLKEENEQLKLKLTKAENASWMVNATCPKNTESYQHLSNENKELKAKCKRLEKEKKDQMKSITYFENELRRYEENTRQAPIYKYRKPRPDSAKSGSHQQRPTSVPRGEENNAEKRNQTVERDNKLLMTKNKLAAAEAIKYQQKCEELRAEISDLQYELARQRKLTGKYYGDASRVSSVRIRLQDSAIEDVTLSETKKPNVCVDQLTKERDDLQQRLSDLDKENENLQEKRRTDVVQLYKLKQQRDTLQNRLEEIARQKGQLALVNKRYSETTKEHELEKNKLLERIHELEQQKGRPANDNTESLDRTKALERRTNELLERLNNAEKDKQSLQEKLKNNDVSSDHIVKENMELQNRIKEFERQNEGLAIVNKRYSDKTEELKRQKNKLLERIEELQRNKSLLAHVNDEFSAKTKEHEREKNELLERINELGRKKQQLADDNTESRDRFEVLKRETTELRDRQTRAENENESVKQKAQQDAVLLKQLEIGLNDAEKENQNLNGKLNQTKASSDKLFKERETLQNRLNDAEKENQNLNGKLNQTKASSDKLFKERERLQNSMRELEGQKHRLESIKKDQRDKIKTLEQEKDSLLTRLSQYTSAQLVQDNPNVADLSDLNRPTKLAEKFSELYDNDWTDAFEVLTDQFGFSEEHGIKRLLDILMVAYQYAIDTADQQVNMLKKALIGPTVGDRSTVTSLKLDSVQLRIIQDLRKQTSQQSVESVKQGLIQHMKTSNLGDPDPSHFLSYINKCAELCWYMVLPSPPLLVASMDSPGDAFDKNKYRLYQTSGKAYRFIVWPALYLHKGGNMLAKGIAEAM